MKNILLESRAEGHAPSCMWVQGMILFNGVFNGSATGNPGMEKVTYKA